MCPFVCLSLRPSVNRITRKVLKRFSQHYGLLLMWKEQLQFLGVPPSQNGRLAAIFQLLLYYIAKGVTIWNTDAPSSHYRHVVDNVSHFRWLLVLAKVCTLRNAFQFWICGRSMPATFRRSQQCCGFESAWEVCIRNPRAPRIRRTLDL